MKSQFLFENSLFEVPILGARMRGLPRELAFFMIFRLSLFLESISYADFGLGAPEYLAGSAFSEFSPNKALKKWK